MRDTKHLLLRGKSWSAKVRIPPSLMKHFGGNTHVIRALKTKSLSVAQHKRHAVVADIKAQFKAADENGIQFSAAKWQERIAAKQFDSSEFVAEVRKVQRTQGDIAAAELSGRSFKLFTELDHLEAQWFADSGFNAKTESRYRHVIKLLRDHIRHLQAQGEDVLECIEDVTAKVAISFRNHLKESSVHKVTGNSYFSALSSRWHYLQEQEAVKDLVNPWAGIRMPKGSSIGTKPKRRPYEDHELVTVFTKGKMRQPLFDVAAMLVSTGMRRGEPFSLKVKDVSAGWFFIPEAKTEAGVRRVPVPDLLKAGLKRIMKGKRPEDFLFVEGGNAKSQKAGYLTGQQFLRHRRGVGLVDDSIPIHSLRHWYSTKADSLGFQRHQIQALIGHDSGERKSVTTVYTHVMDKPKLKIVVSVIKSLPSQVKKSIAAGFGRSN
jgi:integrase